MIHLGRPFFFNPVVGCKQQISRCRCDGAVQIALRNKQRALVGGQFGGRVHRFQLIKKRLFQPDLGPPRQGDHDVLVACRKARVDAFCPQYAGKGFQRFGHGRPQHNRVRLI